MNSSDLGEFKRLAVEMANANRDAMDGTMTPIRCLIADNEMVVAVWQDAEEPDGVGLLVIKGDRFLRTVIAENRPMPARYTAIPCTCIEQAIALKEVAGEPPAHN
jgi:hypothetical protein